MNHPDKEKIITIKENKRVVVHTKTGQKAKGRLVFLDDETIALKGHEIKIADIVKIQHNPLALGIIVDGILFYVGGAAAGAGVLIAAFTGNWGAALVFAVLGTGTILAATLSPKLTKGYKTYKGWSYELVTVPDKN